MDTAKIKWVLEGHSDWMLSVAFSHGGSHVASGSADHTIRIWDVDTEMVRVL